MRNTRGENMRRIFTSCLGLLMIAMLLNVRAFGAELIKLQHTRSVYVDEKGDGFNQPEGVGCNENLLVVADTGNGRLVLYTLQGGDPKGGTEVKIPQVAYPIRVKISSKGDILILDEKLRKVIRLSREGAFKGYVEPSGLQEQSTIIPMGIDRDSNDTIYLLDILAARVVVLNADGKFERQVDFPMGYGFITDLTVDSKRTIFLIDSVHVAVYSNAKDPAVFSPITGSLKDEMKFPSNIITDNNGTLYITDQDGGGLVMLGLDGSLRSRQLGFGWKEGLVRYPSQLCIMKDGSIIVADRENNRVQVFTPLK